MGRILLLLEILLIVVSVQSAVAAARNGVALDQLAAARADVRSHLAEPLEGLDNSDAAKASLAKLWDETAELVCADLNADGDPHADIRDDGLTVDVVALEPDTDLVSASIDAYGTVFIARRANGEFSPAWTIRDLDHALLGTFPLLAAFGVEAATAACKRDVSACGPMTAEIGSLGEDDRGRPQFYVNGYYSTQQGSDVGYQLSVWVWDGSKALPELANTYHQTLDIAPDIRFRAPFLSLHAKDDWTTFFVTSPEPGRQVTWTMMMEGTGVRDLGRSSKVPELDAVDELFFRILRGLPSADIAAPKVRTKVEGAFHDSGVSTGESGRGGDTIGELGELDDSVVLPNAKNVKICIWVDDVDPWRFTLVRKSGAYFIRKATRFGNTGPMTHADFVAQCAKGNGRSG